MSEETSGQAPKKCSSNAHIPPPTDPYVTYQTPYPRNPSEEIQNPFIEFRRLADSVFSSFFSALPRILGTESFKEANIRESDQEYVKAFDRQAQQFEQRIAEMVRARTEEAEGFRKQLEQDWEERRRENEKRMEEENERWEMMRRGLEKCPGLRPDGPEKKREAETELDLYDGLRAYEAAVYKSKADSQTTDAKKCPWKDEKVDKKCPWNEAEPRQNGWLSSLGWDGRRRAKNIPLYITRDTDGEPEYESNVNWQEYRDEEMDPFTNDDHVIPWLRLSPYSPISLINNHTGDEDPCEVRSRQPLNDLPWDEAFEDLMSVHKIGKLPSLVRRLVYWGGPNQWVTDMVLRGSLGSRWEEGFMVAALMGAVDGHHWKGFDGLKEECNQLAGREFRNTLPREPETGVLRNQSNSRTSERIEDKEIYPDNWVDAVRGAFEPRVWEAYDQMEEAAQALFGGRHPPGKAFGAHGMSWPTPEEVISAVAEGVSEAERSKKSEIDRSMEEVVESPAQDSQSSFSRSRSAWNATDENKPDSLISTFTTTTTRTLPDGSVETKRILKKRFADGREENSENTEVIPSSLKTTNSTTTQKVADGVTTDTERKPGWFWN